MNAKKQWYIINVKAGMELKLKEQILKKLKDIEDIEIDENTVLIPMFVTQEVNKQGELETVQKKAMAGYMYLNLHMSDPVLNIILNTIKDYSPKKGQPPMRVSEAQVMRNLNQVASESTNSNIKEYSIGETVLITDGPFEEFSGVIDSICFEKKKLKVSIFIFSGKGAALELDFSFVKKKIEK